VPLVKRPVLSADDWRMAVAPDQPSLGHGVGARLAFDPAADEVVGEQRAWRSHGLLPRERLATLLVGGGFLVAVAALMRLLPADRQPDLAVVGAYLLTYALVACVEFEVFSGASTPTELVLVPMLFALPLADVPIVVAAGLMLASLADWAKGGKSLSRAVLNLVASWHAIGPVVLLALVYDGGLDWERWWVYAAALLVQFAFELAGIGAYELIARGTSPRQLAPHILRTQLVDFALAPVGLVFAFGVRGEPYLILLVLPLVGLLQVFAHERKARIGNALELSAAYRGTAFLLGDVVEADDAYTGLHSRDVVELSVAVAEELGLSADERRETEFVALLHDVGKIRIPSEIINKNGPLTPEERVVMETHAIEGERLLEQVGGLLGRVGHIVRSCHERWDGDGYPDELAGEEIGQIARIVMCCDAFSAMTTDRPYRKALDTASALAELRANAGSQFDPQVVRALTTVVERGALDRPVA
jgi:HD-GYP domain-containing protein (c-di-GMP phosphodiesterase class II)